MSRPAAEGEPRHPIGVVSTRTGLPQDVLRAWERRYGAVVPRRTETGRRLYTDQDLEKLRLLRTAVDSGRRISDVASLSISELEALVMEDQRHTAPVRRRDASGPAEERAWVDQALEAALALDQRRLESTLAEASVELPPSRLRNELIHPFLERLGEEWREGRLRIAHEHLASSVLRTFLGSVPALGEAVAEAPTVILTTPTGQRHELGALLVAVAAAEIGWEAVYLGAHLPATEIALAARQRGARVVALSLIWPKSDPVVVRELRELRRLLGSGVAIFVGGAAASSYGSVIDEIDGHLLDGCADFQNALEALQG